MPVGGFPTDNNALSGVFNKVAAQELSRYVDLTVIHFRYWLPGRKFKCRIYMGEYSYIQLCFPTIPYLHQKWSFWHFMWYRFLIKAFLSKELKEAEIVHCVQGEIGVWFSSVKDKYSFKVLTQFIGTDLISELSEYRTNNGVKNWVKNLDAATFNSKMLKTVFESYYPDFNKYTGVVYRGTNTDKFRPTESNLPKESIVFLYLGGLPKYRFGHGKNLKGGVDVLTAWAKFISDGGKGRLLYAGVNSNEVYVKTFFDTDSIKGVEFLGPLKYDDVIRAYEKADVVILPSRQDGFPNVSIEAQSAGKVVIGSRVGGIPEGIIENTTGLLFDPGDVNQLARLIKQLSIDTKLVNTMSRNSREHILQNFSSSNFAINYLRIYESLVKSVFIR